MNREKNRIWIEKKMYSFFIVLCATLVGSSGGVYYAYYYYGPDPGQIALWMGTVCGWLGMMCAMIWVYLRVKPGSKYQRVSIEV